MKSFVINLRRRPDRLQQFQQRCPLTDIEVVYGFDGKNPTGESKKEQRLFNVKLGNLCKDQPVSQGVRGVFISHLRIWKRIVDQNIPYALIFEDDAQFSSRFMEIYNNLDLENINLLFLGGRFQDNFMMPPQTINKVSEYIGVHNYNTWNMHYHERTAHAYIISYQLAKFLIEMFNIKEDLAAVDYFLFSTLKNNGIPTHSTLPLICWSPMVGDSDIR